MNQNGRPKAPVRRKVCDWPRRDHLFGARLCRWLIFAALLSVFAWLLPVFGGEPVRLNVILSVAGQERTISTTATTVAELLREQQVELGRLDRVLPSLQTALFDGRKIWVDRVQVKEMTVAQQIPQPTASRHDPRIGAGKQVVLHPGRPGRQEQRIRVYSINGREIKREVISSRVVQRPLARRVVQRRNWTMAARGSAARRTLTMVATGYDPGPGSCGRYASGYTCIGIKAGRGVVAVDPRVIPLGSRLYVEGYGYAVAGDVGGAVKGRRIDLGFDTRREALRWGRRTVEVQVLD